MLEYFAYICEAHAYLMPQKPEECNGCPGTGATEGCAPPFGCWEIKLRSSGRAASAQKC